MKVHLSSKGLKKSIKVEAILEEAKKDRGVLAELQGEYVNDVVPRLNNAIQRHLNNAKMQVGLTLGAGVPHQDVAHNPTFKVRTFENAFDPSAPWKFGNSTNYTMTSKTSWNPLGVDYRDQKEALNPGSADYFWKFTGGLSKAYQTLKEGTVKPGRSGFKGGLVPKNLNKELKMSSTFTMPAVKSPVSELLVQPFLAGVHGDEDYQSITDQALSSGLLDRALRQAKGKQSQSNAQNLYKMALAEGHRPFVAQMSSELGRYLGRDLDSTW